MRTGNPTHGPVATSFGSKTLKALTLVALAGLAPVAASTAAASDAASTGAERSVASAAVIELVPVQPTVEVTARAAPSAPAETVVGRGSASYYAAKFDGRRTASGERFDNDEMTAAHRTLPFGSRVRVTNVASGKSVVVRINDRGPFTAGRMIDVSRAAALELGLVTRGHGNVELALIED
ncbi:MAG: septal ring lytic transglycosylase RlpA family protein [Erythrobacter sp.]